MRNLKIIVLIIGLLELNQYLNLFPAMFSQALILLLVFASFWLTQKNEKKIDRIISRFRVASSQVNRSSLKLTGASTKLSDGNDSISKAFNHSMQSIDQISLISEQTLQLVKRNQEQNLLTKNTAEEGIRILKQVIFEIKELANQTAKIRHITSLIDEIAFKTNILSLNAAVEAARAGEQGKGFSVVAEAVRDLAQQSTSATKTINEVLALVVKKAEDGSTLADTSGEKISQILADISQSLKISEQVHSETVRQAHEIQEANRSLKRIDEETALATRLSHQSKEIAQELSIQAATFEDLIADFGNVFSTEIESEQLKKSLNFARQLSHKFSKLLETKCAQLHLNSESLFQFEYEEINANNMSRLGNLFDFRAASQSGFHPAKFLTSYDPIFDKDFQLACDEVYRLGTEYLFAIPVDLNAYAPMHNSKFCKTWTGNPQQDLSGNRVKRFFSDNMTFLKSTRVALGAQAHLLPNRIYSRQELIELGCPLTETKELKQQFLVQTYLRDTGELATNLSVPIFVFGQRYGSVVVCWLESETL